MIHGLEGVRRLIARLRVNRTGNHSAKHFSFPFLRLSPSLAAQVRQMSDTQYPDDDEEDH